ncbi:hypothetical protein C1H46_001835 [Malus baccata]|uniref:Uncharacterized protein n=1 Tax=Malus baccata TaxID=106549 RepID=A0A540NPT6_MALBA|nr:hypothetical protein C1H46_001835 [Malus baccata]
MAARKGRWWRVVTSEWAGAKVLPWLQQKELRDLNERLNRDVGRVNVGEVRGRDGVANSPWYRREEEKKGCLVKCSKVLVGVWL